MSRLLSENDWNGIAVALRKGKEFQLTRSMGSVTVEVCTAPASAAWDVPMLVGVVLKHNGEVRNRQWLPSVEAARETVERWKV